MNLDHIRLKTEPDLSPDEVDFLKQNSDQLNDEDKEAYANILKADEPEDMEEKPAESEPKTPETAEPENTPESQPVFKTQEELDKYIEDKLKAQESRPVEPPKQEEKTDPVFFKEGEVPKTWDELAKTVYLKAKEDAKKEWKEMTTKEQEEVKAKQEQAKKAMDGFHSEYDQLAKDGKVPARDTEEGKKAWEAIWKVGNDYGRGNITESYNLWANLSPELGGGLQVDPKKQRLQAQKSAASKLGKGGSEPRPESNVKSYEKFKRESLDDVIERKLG